MENILNKKTKKSDHYHILNTAKAPSALFSEILFKKKAASAAFEIINGKS